VLLSGKTILIIIYYINNQSIIAKTDSIDFKSAAKIRKKNDTSELSSHSFLLNFNLLQNLFFARQFKRQDCFDP